MGKSGIQIQQTLSLFLIMETSMCFSSPRACLYSALSQAFATCLLLEYFLHMDYQLLGVLHQKCNHFVASIHASKMFNISNSSRPLAILLFNSIDHNHLLWFAPIIIVVLLVVVEPQCLFLRDNRFFCTICCVFPPPKESNYQVSKSKQNVSVSSPCEQFRRIFFLSPDFQSFFLCRLILELSRLIRILFHFPF